MNQEYPDYKMYRKLYARFYNRGLDTLIQQLQPLRGMRVADLCGGDGRLTEKILVEGAQHVTLIDEQPNMVPCALSKNARVTVLPEKVQTGLRQSSFDRIVCQQAVNYWLDAESAKTVALALEPLGTFIFNTFNEKPSTKQRVLEYELNRHTFVEVSWCIGDHVHHLQTRDGLPPHYTVFNWLSSKKIHEILEPYFTVHENKHGKTSLYRCEKK